MCGGLLVAIAAVMYLLLPGLLTAHSVVFHADEHANEHAAVQDEGDCDPIQDPGDSSEPQCELCWLIGTLGNGSDVPPPAPGVAGEITATDCFIPLGTFCQPADPRSTPGSPRAPPRI